MKQIEILGMKFFAHHGWHEIEQKIGQYFTVDILCNIKTDNTINDDLNNTIDYQKLYDKVQYQMKQPHKLIESLLDNIGGDLLNSFPALLNISIKIHKQPILGGAIDEICISATYYSQGQK